MEARADGWMRVMVSARLELMRESRVPPAQEILPGRSIPVRPWHRAAPRRRDQYWLSALAGLVSGSALMEVDFGCDPLPVASASAIAAQAQPVMPEGPWRVWSY